MAYVFDDDPGRVDVELVWKFLSEHAYWGRWRTREDVGRQVSGVWRVVGGYEEPVGGVGGFARATSDGGGVAYLPDGFVLPGHRGPGLGPRPGEGMVGQ